MVKHQSKSKVDQTDQVAKMARQKVKKLREMELVNNYSQRGRKVALVISLFLNLTFLVTIYAILVKNQ